MRQSPVDLGNWLGEGENPVDVQVIDEIAQEVVGIELATIFTAKDQPMPGGELRRQRLVKRFVDDGAAAHRERVFDPIEHEHDID